MKKINQEQFNKLTELKPFCDSFTTTLQKIKETPLTNEILQETIEKMNSFKNKENLKKLLREFLETIEKNNIKEVLFFDNPLKEKDWKAIFMI